MKAWEFRKALLNLLFPLRSCPLCGSRGTAGLCSCCQNFVAAAAAEPFCPVCGRFFRGSGTGVCRECASREWPFVFCRAVFPYEGALREAVHRLKFGGRRAAVDYLGGLMAAVWEREPRYQQGELLVPVPLGPERLRERGFNQAALLAAALSEKCRIRCLPVLAKDAGVPPQAQLGRSARQINVTGVFKVVDRKMISGKTVVVVDDVFTTGSTMAAVASALLEGGAHQVFGLVLGAGRTFPLCQLPHSFIDGRGFRQI
ncbi:double zinc ribbon domain-containing protein [Thermodesulfitimonas sp.]